ncbi:hypothetical protein [Chryseobacterium sp. HMWF035]|uniref:hypothetical protein n=1 Tax=Chryseobacterium sp. HMWF035 TaxID=2056868 RepID=UPI000D570F37|nr:hypothetical protein [Chryseobacterium sp. HMWF035]PVV50436.1 hypothetical protein DD829_22495 [Chryseobacterium sp. HMWF035]
MTTNPTKDRLLILCYLTFLQNLLQAKRDFRYCEILLTLLEKEDLIAVILWIGEGELPEDLTDVETMDKEELLDFIGGDFIVVPYLIEYWKSKTDYPVTPEKVHHILTRLQLQNHYLREKNIPDWDPYDYSNYNTLCEKAGIPKTVYGIFDNDVSEEDKYITAPLHGFFHHEHQAQTLLNDREDKESYKILML